MTPPRGLVAAWSAWALAALVGGCASGELAGPDLGPTEPLMMSPAATGELQRRRVWMGRPDGVGSGEVRRMGVVAKVVPSPVRGQRCILCRLILFGADYKPVRSDGPIEAVLIARPNTPDERVVGSWTLTAAEAAERFRYGRLPGYFLDLRRPSRAGASLFMLVLRWTSADGSARRTNRITVEDSFGYDAPAIQPSDPR